MGDGHLVGGLGSGILGTAILVLPHSLAFNQRELLIVLITTTLFSNVDAGINVLLRPLPFPASFPHSATTPTMCGRLAPALDIPVAVAGTVTKNLTNSTFVPRISCGSAINEVHDVSSSTCKVRPKAGLVRKNVILAGFEDSLGNTIQEVTYFLVLAPLGNYMNHFRCTIVKGSPLIMQG